MLHLFTLGAPIKPTEALPREANLNWNRWPDDLYPLELCLGMPACLRLKKVLMYCEEGILVETLAYFLWVVEACGFSYPNLTTALWFAQHLCMCGSLVNIFRTHSIESTVIGLISSKCRFWTYRRLVLVLLR